MKIRFSMLLLLCLLMLSSMCANTLYAQEFVSANPRYAAVVLPEFSPKGILVVFDESAGTGKGYDTVYVDANLDGTISKDERFSDESGAKRSSEQYHFIDPIMIEPAEKKSVSYEISFILLKLKKGELFGVDTYRDMQYNGKRWSATYSGSIVPSKVVSRPFIYKPIRETKAEVKSSTTKKVTGIAISLISGSGRISSSDVTVNLLLKNQAGKTVKKAQGSLDKFGFG